MRSETQQWEAVAVRLEVVNAGVGETGLAPVATLQRVSDSLWYDFGSNDFTSATPVLLSMTGVVGLDGLYEFVPAFPSLSPPSGAGVEGYRFTASEPTHLIRETGHISVVSAGISADDVWNYDVDNTAQGNAAGSRLRNASEAVALGEGARRDPLHFANAPSGPPDGKFYTATITPSAEATEAYAGRRAILWIATLNKSFSCVIEAVANDGADYFQLAREDGGVWDLNIAASDRLIVATELFQSFDATAVWSEPTSGYTVAGTFGEGFRRMLALRQENMRVVYTAWNEVNVPTDGVIYIYPSKAALDADSGGTGVGAFGSYSFTANFGGTPAIQPTEYTSGKLT